MGEVYRARDPRLDREVAIKVLPAHLAADPQMRERFEREARAISQLSHPHICTLHDVGHDHETSYLVMELLDGVSLADRLSRGPLPVEQLLRFAVQIAEALAGAHRHGIIHRDLKPGNVMITKSGAKLLDFGLARSEAAGRGPRGSLIETEHKPLTEEGTILGTFQYMAPEQLEGIQADARTDIFSFGVLLYEMATGRRAFEGKTRTSLIAAIVASEPRPMSEYQPLTPPALEHVVRKCLSKNPDERWQSAHDIAEELRWISEVGSQAGVAAPISSRRKVRDRALIALAIAALLLSALMAMRLLRERPVAARVVHASIVPPVDSRFEYSRADSSALTVSPDGRFITFAAIGAGGKPMLWIRALDSEKAQPLTGTEDARSPFWSPDSRAIAFFVNGKLKRMDIGGGPAVTIADASDGRGGGWNRDGVILFEPYFRAPIYRVHVNGGAVTQVTTLDEKAGETTHRWATFLPDGRHFLFLAGSHRTADSDQNSICLASIDSPERKILLRARSNAIYIHGFILYARENWLLAQPFDAKSLALTGDPIRVAENVTYDSGFFRAAFGASDDGTLAYFTGPSVEAAQLAWYDRGGRMMSKIGAPLEGVQTDVQESLRLSPDETHAAIEIGDPADIWIFDLKRDARTRFTNDPMNDFAPVWSPDGKTIMYSNDRDVATAIYEKSTDGLGREKLVAKSARFLISSGWSPDGKYLAMNALDPVEPDTKVNVWILPLTGDRKPAPFVESSFRQRAGRFSADGRWLTFLSDESGQQELYALSFPAHTVRHQLTDGGVTDYMWRRDGREIIVVAPDHTVSSIAVNGDTFGAPKLLFKSDARITAGDVTRDGSRILVAVVEPRPPVPITLVTNWSAAAK